MPVAGLAEGWLPSDLPCRVFASARARNPLWPAAVDVVLHRGLARDPDERYGSVAECRRDLDAALTDGIAPPPRTGTSEAAP